MGRCQGTTAAGTKCKKEALSGNFYCTSHKAQAQAQEQTPPPLQQGYSQSGNSGATDIDVANMRQRLQQLEQENIALKATVDKKKISKARMEKKAKMLFYHDNKDRPDVVNEIRSRLAKGNLMLVRKNGDDSKEIIPWVFVKECTDMIWNDLPDEDKGVYLSVAVERLRQKDVEKANRMSN